MNSKEKIDKVVNEVRALGGGSIAVSADVISGTVVKETLDPVVAGLDGLDVVSLKG